MGMAEGMENEAIGAAYEVVIGAAMEYEGRMFEVVAIGIKAGNNGAASGSAAAAVGTGAGAAFLEAFFFFFFLPPHIVAAMAP